MLKLLKLLREKNLSRTCFDPYLPGLLKLTLMKKRETFQGASRACLRPQSAGAPSPPFEPLYCRWMLGGIISINSTEVAKFPPPTIRSATDTCNLVASEVFQSHSSDSCRCALLSSTGSPPKLFFFFPKPSIFMSLCLDYGWFYCHPRKAKKLCHQTKIQSGQRRRQTFSASSVPPSPYTS